MSSQDKQYLNYMAQYERQRVCYLRCIGGVGDMGVDTFYVAPHTWTTNRKEAYRMTLQQAADLARELNRQLVLHDEDPRYVLELIQEASDAAGYC